MKPFDFLAVKLTLFLVLGIFLGHSLNIPLFLSFGIAIGGLCLLGWAVFRKSYPPLIFAGIALLATMATGVVFYNLAIEADHHGHYSQNDYRTKGLWKIKLLEVGKENTYDQVYVGRVLQLSGEPVRGKIRLLIKKSEQHPDRDFRIDDEVFVWGNAREVPRPKNTYQWDFSAYLRKQNIYHQIRVDPGQVCLLEGSRSTLKGWAYSIREQLIRGLEEAGFGDKELGVIKALLLGQREDIAPETLRQYQRAGAMHILAISGLHIGIILIILRFVFRPLTYLPGGRHLSLLLAIVSLWAYAFITGFSPSVIRATAMFSFLAYTLFLNRLSQGYNTLALSMFFLLVVVDPLLLFQVGFQMSYTAVMAILWVYPVLQKCWHPRPWFLRKAWQLIAVSLSAQIGVLPISLYYFHQFPALFLLSSLLIVPSLGLILGGGILMTAFASLKSLSDWAVYAYNSLIAQMNHLVEWVAGQEDFFVENIPFDNMEMALAYAFLIGLILLLQKPSYLKIRTCLCLLLLLQGWGLFREINTGKTERILIMHQYTNSALLYQNGTKLAVHSAKPHLLRSTIRDFKLGARIKSISYQELQKSYHIGTSTLVRVDAGEFTFPPKQNRLIWLTDSPRINLDRYLAYHQPDMVIADGSNYSYLIRRWKESCELKKIPFHYTGEKGTYAIDLRE